MSRKHQEYDLRANIQQVLTVMQSDGNGGEDTNTFADEEEKETIHVYPVEGGGILLTRTPIADDDDLDTVPLPTQPVHQSVPNATTGILFFSLSAILTCLMCIMFQIYLIINPLTVTLLARSQQLSLSGSLQLGRVLNPITLSQSQTAPTTGHGHQSAQQATGYITFYNGQLQSVFVPAGTVLTGTSGEQIYRQVTRRCMDRSAFQHTPKYSVSKEIYLHMTSINHVVLSLFLPRTLRPLAEEQTSEIFK